MTDQWDPQKSFHSQPPENKQFHVAAYYCPTRRRPPQLSKPGGAATDETGPWIRVERVVYSDGANPADFATGVDPWPTEPDGQGASLGRIDPTAYGNDPANWQAIAPSPGTAN